ncbi:MAG: cytochrome C biogenesis protein CcsB, partial [Erysipelotrichaceae bacterium]|nr:cytochrome C biogenesis protein CcsB [Erysipelotrichaceae bacterium]
MKLSYLGIFLEGLLSFLSPCVLPLLPVYMAYLSGDGKTTDEEGNVRYERKQVFLNTVFFVLGISMVFVLLAISAEKLRTFLGDYQEIVSIIGGTLII